MTEELPKHVFLKKISFPLWKLHHWCYYQDKGIASARTGWSFSSTSGIEVQKLLPVREWTESNHMILLPGASLYNLSFLHIHVSLPTTGPWQAKVHLLLRSLTSNFNLHLTDKREWATVRSWWGNLQNLSDQFNDWGRLSHEISDVRGQACGIIIPFSVT